MSSEQNAPRLKTQRQAPADSTKLDELMPRFHFQERHSRLVAASPDRVYDAIWTVTLREMPLVPALLYLRSLPGILTGKGSLSRNRDEPLLAQMLAGRFTLLAEEPGMEVVAGLIGQTWKPIGGLVRVRDSAEFLSFGLPGYVKVATNLRLEPHQRGTRISTQTRVLAMDPASRRRFGLYWLVIRGGSGAIRRSWLYAIARRAERSAH